MIGNVGAEGDAAHAIPISVENGQIKIGDRTFKVKAGGAALEDPVLLAKIAGLLRKSFQQEAPDRAHLPMLFSGNQPDTVRLTINAAGVSVYRGEQKKAQLEKTEGFTKKFEKLGSLMQSRNSFKDAVNQLLSSKKYTHSELSEAARRIFDERDNFPYAEGSSFKTLAYHLQLPGNEGRYSILKQLADRAPTGKPKNVAKCEKELRSLLSKSMGNPKIDKPTKSTAVIPKEILDVQRAKAQANLNQFFGREDAFTSSLQLAVHISELPLKKEDVV
ncbi:MAG: hypothetical protein JSR46_09610, partial [Verrucomicrobia bacterium]|nr:hypothetical protein [Verrucomicrobiota bacterium]